MRIAVVHSFYRSSVPSGENTVVLDQVEALREGGHEVRLVRRDSDAELASPLYPVRAANRVLTGRGPSPTDELEEFAPDVVHVHNLFPGFGTDWLPKWKGPVVSTLHNFRSICANGLLFRDGAQCFACPDGDSFASVRFGCYHDSRISTIPLAVRNSRGLDKNHLMNRADAFICLSRASAEVFRAYGLESGMTFVVPNGLRRPEFTGGVEASHRGKWVAAGRFTPEKGLLSLVEEWPSGHVLDVIGEGLEQDAMKAASGPRVNILPFAPRQELLGRLPCYEGLIFPSKCLDSQPTIVTEALAAGLPIVCRTGNSVATLVSETGCGVTYSNADELKKALEQVAGAREHFVKRATDTYNNLFTREQWVAGLESVYAFAREGRRRSARGA